MKKRGFSLVELLAVMIILGVIISLAIPKIGNIKDSFKKKAFTTNTYSLVKMAEKIYQESHLGSLKEESELYRIQDGKIFNNGTELALIDGKIEGNGFIQLTSDGLSKIAIENDEFCAVKEFTQAEVIVNKRVEGTPCGKVFIPFSYDLNGGDTTQDFSDSYLETTEIVLQNPTKEDAVFDKWVVVKGNSTIKDNVLTIGNRDTKIYALWVMPTMLTVNLNGGSSSQSNNGKYKAGTNIILDIPTRIGYTFIGWEVVSGDSIISGNTITIGSTDTTIKAKWQIDKVNINYNLNGGTSGSSAPTEGNYGTIVTVSKPSKIGYTFTNWTVSGTGASINDTSLTIGTSDVTLTANWTINTYTITYNLDGGTFQNEMPTQAEYGSTIILENPIKEGYVFVGWSVTSGNGVVSGNTFTMGSEDKTIKALWKKAQALYTESDKTLTFVLSDHEYVVGETYDNKTITNVYTGFDTKTYECNSETSTVNTPWFSIAGSVKTVIFNDKISPLSTANWFYKFENCANVYLEKLDLSHVHDISRMFYRTGYNVSSFNVVGLDNMNTSNVTDMSFLFTYSGYSAKTFNIGDLSNWDTSSVINMKAVFGGAGYNATTFNIGNLSNWDTSSSTNMSAMFQLSGYKSNSFNIGSLSNWDTSNVTDMSGMFNKAAYSAQTFNIGDLSSWDTSNVIDMHVMFQYAGYGAKIFNIGDLSSWDTSNVVDMSWLFNKAGYSATTFNIGDLSSWNTSNVTNMYGMFQSAGYSATYSLNLSSWNVSKVTNHDYFNGDVTSKVIAPKWVN